MFKRKLFFLFVSFCLAASAKAEPPLRLSLQDCLDLASKNSAKMEASGYDIERAEWQYSEANAAFKPVLEWSDRMAPVPRDAQNAAESFFSGDVTFFNSAKIGVGVPVATFGKIAKAKSLAEKGIEAAKEKKAKQKEEIYFDVKRLYFGILLGEELKTLAVDTLQKVDDKLKGEEKNPEHSPYDIAKLKIFRLDLQRKFKEAEEKGDLARQALKVQLGLNREKSVELADNALDPLPDNLQPMDHYLKLFADARPDAALVNIGIRAKQLEWGLEKRKWYPNIGLGGFVEMGRTSDSIRNLGATDDFNNPFNYTRAGIGLEIKGQFDFHGSRAKIRRLRSEYNKVLMEGGLAREGIALEVEEAHQEAKMFRANLQLAEEKEKLAHQMVFLSKSNLDIGVGEEKDYTDALQLLLFSKGEYYKAVFDYNVALAKLDWKVGGAK